MQPAQTALVVVIMDRMYLAAHYIKIEGLDVSQEQKCYNGDISTYLALCFAFPQKDSVDN